MLADVFLLLLLAQYQVDPIRQTEAFQLLSTAQDDAGRRAEQQREAARRMEFEQRLNDLTIALREFTDEYNRNQGQVWPVKKAEAVKKAMQKLQKTQAWSGGRPVSAGPPSDGSKVQPQQ